jgi:hypothetical protein
MCDSHRFPRSRIDDVRTWLITQAMGHDSQDRRARARPTGCRALIGRGARAMQDLKRMSARADVPDLADVASDEHRDVLMA